ncbi:head completion/stabilization protein [Pantoea agglomerans]
MVERYRGYDASGTKKAGEIEASADEYWRDARFSISRIAGKPGCIVDLL